MRLLQRVGVRLVHQQLPRLQRGEAELGGPLRLLLHGCVGGVLPPPHAVPRLVRLGPLPRLDHRVGARAAARARLVHPVHSRIVTGRPLEPRLCLLLLLLLCLHLGLSRGLPGCCGLAWPGLLPCVGSCSSCSSDSWALSLPGLPLQLLRVLLLVRAQGAAAPASLLSSRPLLVIGPSPTLPLFWLAALSSSLLGGGPCLPMPLSLLAALSSSVLGDPSLPLLLLLGACSPIELLPTLSSSPNSAATLRLRLLVPGLVGLHLLVLLLQQALLVPVLHQLLVVVALLRLGRGLGLAHAPAGSHAHELHGPAPWQRPGISPSGVCLQWGNTCCGYHALQQLTVVQGPGSGTEQWAPAAMQQRRPTTAPVGVSLAAQERAVPEHQHGNHGGWQVHACHVRGGNDAGVVLRRRS